MEKEDKKIIAYWVGEGVLGDIGYGGPIFEGMISEKTLKKEYEAGNIKESFVSESVASGVEKAGFAIKELQIEKDNLEKMVSALEKDKAKLNDKITVFEKETDSVLKEKLTQANANVKDLKKEVKKLKTDLEKAGGK